jgi:hypothetical protein
MLASYFHQTTLYAGLENIKTLLIKPRKFTDHDSTRMSKNFHPALFLLQELLTYQKKLCQGFKVKQLYGDVSCHNAVT